MKKRWIGSLTLGIFMLALGANPSVARLNEGNFIPFSQAVSSIADSRTQLYIIQKGDTLYQIAERYGVSLENLMFINEMEEDSILTVGDILKIPASKGDVYVIVAGDTLSALAEHYRISMEALIDANRDKDPNCLAVGDQINIPDGDNKQLDKSTSEPSRSISMPGMMAWPILGTITSYFGQRQSGFHHGIDIAAKIGTPIHAAASGTVSFVGTKSVYGRTVIINHPDGKQTLYAHTQKIYVQAGEKVSRGQTIAAVGMTGFTTGPHVHFEIRYGNIARNPLSYLRR